MRNKKGFTLIEAVICIAMIGLLSVAFMQITTASLQANSSGTRYDRASAALVSALENDETPADMTSTENGTLKVNLGGGQSVTLHERDLHYKDETSGITYYTYR